MRSVDEMSIEEVKDVIDGVDWVEVHKQLYENDFGSMVYIWTDGSLSVLGSNSSYQDPSAIIGWLKCWGGDVDRGFYLDGWGDYDYDTGVFTTSDGRELTEEEGVLECIEAGDWSDAIEHWKEQIVDEVLEDWHLRE